MQWLELPFALDADLVEEHSLRVGGGDLITRARRAIVYVVGCDRCPYEEEEPLPVDLDDNQRIRRFQEKPKREEAFSSLINAGAYALGKCVQCMKESHGSNPVN